LNQNISDQVTGLKKSIFLLFGKISDFFQAVFVTSAGKPQKPDDNYRLEVEFMLTKQNIKSHTPSRLFGASPGRGPLVPQSPHSPRAKPHRPCPSLSPATGRTQQQSQTPACVGWSCFGQLYVYKLLLPRVWSKGKAAVVELGVGRVEAAVLGLLLRPDGLPACHSIPGARHPGTTSSTAASGCQKEGMQAACRELCSCLCSI